MKSILKATSLISRVIISEIPFLMAFCLLLGYRTFCFLHGFLFSNDIDSSHSILSFFDEISILLFVAFIFAALIHFSKSLVVRVLVYSCLFILFSIEFFLWNKFGTSISPHILLLIGETNQKETSEFIDEYFFNGNNRLFLLLGGVFVLILVLEFIRNKIILVLSRTVSKRVVLIVAIPLILNGIASCRTYMSVIRCKTTDDVALWRRSAQIKPIDTISNVLYSIYHLKIAGDEMEQAVLSTSKICKEHIDCCSQDSLSVVVVIGESYIKRHSSIYGYKLMNCPYMQKERMDGNLFVFSDVITPFAGTSRVIRNVLCCNSLSSGEKCH